MVGLKQTLRYPLSVKPRIRIILRRMKRGYRAAFGRSVPGFVNSIKSASEAASILNEAKVKANGGSRRIRR